MAFKIVLASSKSNSDFGQKIIFLLLTCPVSKNLHHHNFQNETGAMMVAVTAQQVQCLELVISKQFTVWKSL